MSAITIRSIGPDDAHLLDRARPGLIEAPDASRAWSFLAIRVNEMLIAVSEGEVVGYLTGTVLLHPVEASAFLIRDVTVHPDVRRSGIGRKLVERAVDLAWDRGSERVEAEFDAANPVAQAFFAALGAESSGDRHRVHWEA